MRTVVKNLNDLKYTKEHLGELKKAPLWMLFDSMYGLSEKKLKNLLYMYKKHEENVKELILAFDTRVKKIVLRSDMVGLTARDMQLIFGISGGK